MMQKRTQIPKDIANLTLFLSDRTCCVCRVPRRAIQIHHLDGNNDNHELDNLAVLCLQCHDETQIKGGFGRKLNSELIKLYRNEFYIDNKKRLKKIIPNFNSLFKKITLPKKKITSNPQLMMQDTEFIHKTIDLCHEKEDWALLAYQYKWINQKELGYKYAKKCIEESINNEEWIRVVQMQLDFLGSENIEPEFLKKAVNSYLKNRNFSQLARLYRDLGNPELATISYNKSIEIDIRKREWFSAGYYLKESGNLDRAKVFLKRALKENLKKGDVHWIIRCYEELEMFEELKNFAEDIVNSEKIKEINPPTRLDLMRIVGNEEEVKKLLKNMRISMKRK